MKKLILAAICSLLFGVGLVKAQTPITKTIKIYGNCDMCKENIESALKKKDGVLKKDWEKDTKMLTVTYDASKINLTQIKQKIADAGYDSDSIRATDAAYNKLHTCCQYDRPKK